MVLYLLWLEEIRNELGKVCLKRDCVTEGVDCDLPPRPPLLDLIVVDKVGVTCSPGISGFRYCEKLVVWKSIFNVGCDRPSLRLKKMPWHSVRSFVRYVVNLRLLSSSGWT